MAPVSMAMPLSSATQNRLNLQPSYESFLKPLPVRPSKAGFMAKTKSRARLQVQASLKEKAVTGLTAAALSSTSMVILSPSPKNLLLSIAAGGVVLAALIETGIGVSNFVPVERS